MSFPECASRILTAQHQQHLGRMFPHGAPVSARLLVAKDGGIPASTFKDAMRGVPEATLSLIRTTTGFIFGAVVFDPADMLSDASDDKRHIAGHPDNFLFNIAGHGAATTIKLLRHPSAEHGLCVGAADCGLICGVSFYGDLCTFYGEDGTANNWCNPVSFTVVAPGYPQVPVTNATLAGEMFWTPERSEVFALTFPPAT